MKIEPKRTIDQNNKMWAMLGDVAKQLPWSVNGVKTHISTDDWKDIFTAGLTKGQRVAEGIEGGWVLLGERTHNYKKSKMADLIEYMYAFGADKEVVWSEPEKWGHDERITAP